MIKKIIMGLCFISTSVVADSKWEKFEDHPFQGLTIEIRDSSNTINGIDTIWTRFMSGNPDKQTWVVINTVVDCNTLMHMKTYRQSNNSKQPNLEITKPSILTDTDLLYYPIKTYCDNKIKVCQVETKEDLKRTSEDEVIDMMEEEFKIDIKEKFNIDTEGENYASGAVL